MHSREKPMNNSWNGKLFWKSHRKNTNIWKHRGKWKESKEDYRESCKSCNGFYRMSKWVLLKKALRVKGKFRGRRTLQAPSISDDDSLLTFLSIKSARKKDSTEISIVSDQDNCGKFRSTTSPLFEKQPRVTKSTGHLETSSETISLSAVIRSERLRAVRSESFLSCSRFHVKRSSATRNNLVAKGRLENIRNSPQKVSATESSTKASCRESSGFTLEKKSNNMASLLEKQRTFILKEILSKPPSNHYFQQESKLLLIGKKPHSVSYPSEPSEYQSSEETSEDESYSPLPRNSLLTLLGKDPRELVISEPRQGPPLQELPSEDESSEQPVKLKERWREVVKKCHSCECFGKVEYPVTTANEEPRYERLGETANTAFLAWCWQYICCWGCCVS